jgi:hypothetical protein
MRRRTRGVERISPASERLTDQRREFAAGGGRHKVADHQAAAM